ncbi:MAG: shikimate kinase [Chitinophagaceae bacterium]|nr:MAG: shikimate kinase [Chitinophagaceae bacterium]
MSTATIFGVNDRPLFLVGFMGSGKTYWGSKWAAALHRTFFDLDHVIEEQEQYSVAELFFNKGESWFRQKEAEVLRSLSLRKNVLIACGGGTACFHSNMDLMNHAGATIFLDASPTYLLQNILKEPLARPLLQNMDEVQILEFIKTKLQEREPFYRESTFILNAESLNEDSLNYL